MKKVLILLSVLVLILCSCNNETKKPDEQTDGTEQIILAGEPAAIDKQLIGKWIDVETEKIHEYTIDGYYYEWINENFTSEKTRYIANGGKLYYYLDSQGVDMKNGLEYSFNESGNLVISGVLEYKPMDIKTSVEEME